MNDLKYFEDQGLSELIDLGDVDPAFKDPFAMVRLAALPAAPPEVADLVRIHRLIRERRPFTVLEFGVGHSTIVIADALRKNSMEWAALENAPPLRNRFQFQCFTVDASEAWLSRTETRFPAALRPFVRFQHSDVRIATHNGQLCHFYESLPDVVPDFIYVDGPDPKDVKGSINGLSFQCDERTVLAADVLLMESTLLPGAFVLFDGRTNNARFVTRNLQRSYEVKWDREGDITTLELVEDRLGPLNILARDVMP